MDDNSAPRRDRRTNKKRGNAKRRSDPASEQQSADGSGPGERRIPLTGFAGKRVQRILDRRRIEFIDEFGREPGPADPIFFERSDPRGSRAPEPMSEETVRTELARPQFAEESGIEHAFLLTMSELGYAVSDQNRHLHSAADVARFEQVLKRYRRQAGEASQ